MGNLKDILDFAGRHPVLTFFSLFIVGATISESVGYITRYKPEIQHRQVINNHIEDTFIEYNGVKYFSKIDGLNVESYHQK